jgi:hypothetical protein
MPELREEVRLFMSHCERLLGFATREGELTVDECDVIRFYAGELAEKIEPYCTKSDHSACETSP